MSLSHSKPDQELIAKADKYIKQLQKLAPETNATVLKKLLKLKEELISNDSKIDSVKEIELTLDTAKQLIQNLKYARDAAKFATSKLNPSNRPFVPAINSKLEKKRTEVNNALIDKFGLLKKQREHLAKKTGNLSIGTFDQSAYRKGTGISMGMWYWHALHKKSIDKFGNCTELANTAFGHLYSLARENFSHHKDLPFDNLERIDVTNSIGGHCYLLMDRKKTKKIQLNEKYPVGILLNEATNLGDTCVVIDPWDSLHPFYPAADMPKNMPQCGKEGEMNIEFGLNFSVHEAPKIK